MKCSFIAFSNIVIVILIICITLCKLVQLNICVIFSDFILTISVTILLTI